MLKAHLERMRLGMEREKARLAALQKAIDNQNKELEDAAVARREKECLKHAAIKRSGKECLKHAANEENEKECLEDTGNLKVSTYYHWFCEIVGLVPKTKEHKD